MYRRCNLSSPKAYSEFDAINQSLMGDSFTKSVNDYTELDWIIKQSRYQILFYDERQRIRSCDIDAERYNNICRPHIFKYVELFSQMRCKGGNGYYDYIKKILEGTKLNAKSYMLIQNYEVRIIDHIEDLFEIINKKEQSDGLCRVVCGPGWGAKEDIIIENPNPSQNNTNDTNDTSNYKTNVSFTNLDNCEKNEIIKRIIPGIILDTLLGE